MAADVDESWTIEAVEDRDGSCLDKYMPGSQAAGGLDGRVSSNAAAILSAEPMYGKLIVEGAKFGPG